MFVYTCIDIYREIREKRESILTTTYVSIEFHLFSSVTKPHDYPCWDGRLIQIWKNELNAILLNQPGGWLVWLFCAEDKCVASGRNNTTWFFRSSHSFSAGSWEKDTCYTSKLCELKVGSMKISEEEQTVSFSVLECFLEIKGVYRILF